MKMKIKCEEKGQAAILLGHASREKGKHGKKEKSKKSPSHDPSFFKFIFIHSPFSPLTPLPS